MSQKLNKIEASRTLHIYEITDADKPYMLLVERERVKNTVGARISKWEERCIVLATDEQQRLFDFLKKKLRESIEEDKEWARKQPHTAQ